MGGVGEAEACCLSSMSERAGVDGAVGLVWVGEQGEDFSGDARPPQAHRAVWTLTR